MDEPFARNVIAVVALPLGLVVFEMVARELTLRLAGQPGQGQKHLHALAMGVREVSSFTFLFLALALDAAILVDIEELRKISPVIKDLDVSGTSVVVFAFGVFFTVIGCQILGLIYQEGRAARINALSQLVRGRVIGAHAGATARAVEREILGTIADGAAIGKRVLLTLLGAFATAVPSFLILGRM